jgi:hypothetical protein
MERRSIAAEVAAKRGVAHHVMRFVEPGMDVAVGAANGEPVACPNFREQPTADACMIGYLT